MNTDLERITKEKADAWKAKSDVNRHGQQAKFEALGIPGAHYVGKMQYRIGKVRVMRIYQSDMLEGEDLYTEKVNREIKPEDPQRILYKWSWRSNWKNIYEQDENNGCYYIPCEDLVALPSDLNELKKMVKPKTELKSAYDHYTIEECAQFIQELSKVISSKIKNSKSFN